MEREKADQKGLTRRRALLTSIGGLCVLGAAKGHVALGLRRGESGRVLRVIDGDSFVLKTGEGELSVRLASIEAPHFGREDKPAWPLANEAKSALLALTRGQDINLYYADRKRDRFGRSIAQAYIASRDGTPETWIQSEMIKQGFARVYSWPGEQSDIASLYRLEQNARDQKRGIWSDPFYAIRSPDPDPLAQFVDSVQIIEGIVTSTADVRGQIYLNFGADYKTDFTVAVARKFRRKFEAIDPLSLEGARVRVRGWIELYNGPMIWIDHPERLEVLD